MSRLVLKFGGTSVGSLERIEAVAEQVMALRSLGHQLVVVVSAMAGETNRLVEMAYRLSATPNPRELDMLMATGEQVSMSLLATVLSARGCPARSFTGGQAGIVTSSVHGGAMIENIDTAALEANLAEGAVAIVAGFQGCDAMGEITTLGRGGSDYTAVALAAALAADECQIFTDVDGVYSADPRIVPSAVRHDCIRFTDMLAMAEHGAKVLQYQSVHSAYELNVPLRVLSSFTAGHSTLVTFDHLCPVKPIAGLAGVAQLLITIPSKYLIEFRTNLTELNLQFQLLQEQADDVTLIVCDSDEGKIPLELKQRIRHIIKVFTLSIVGQSAETIRHHAIEALSLQGIAVHQYSLADSRLSLTVDSDDYPQAATLLHEKFVVCDEFIDNAPLLAVS
ncbi:Aspartate kinase [Vibrio stylophorae]|uniref:Aspartokinase n=1 Tax=Vibrio stylophorae TaxID=659351 RepID=A0ABM8ZVU9_9VIBR|nr:aspartate kinase [Vibrio stylophorae]CAH0534340.1 Aspartate kinase [Vibrio stylophorae]